MTQMKIRSSSLPTSVTRTSVGAPGPVATAPRPNRPGGDHGPGLSGLTASALAAGGTGRALIIVGILIATRGSAALPLLALGVLLMVMAIPGWRELALMESERIGGASSDCTDAFRPYGPILSTITGISTWWSGIPASAFSALIAAQIIHTWWLPAVPATMVAIALIIAFAAITLAGPTWTGRIAVPLAAGSFGLALLSGIVPVLSGRVEWSRSFAFHLRAPFPGLFGHVSSAMAGLFLVGFIAPALLGATDFVGSLRSSKAELPRVLRWSALTAVLYGVVLPVLWVGTVNSTALERHVASALGPTFAPLFGGAAQGVAIGFALLAMGAVLLQSLAGPPRNLTCLSEDAHLPRSLLFRSSRTGAPVVAISVTAGASVVCLLVGHVSDVLAAATFAGIVAITLSSVAVLALRRNEPDRNRPYRANIWVLRAGLAASGIWMVAVILGFGQFGLSAVGLGVILVASGAIAFQWRQHTDRRAAGLVGPHRSVYLKLAGLTFTLLALLSIGYIRSVDQLVGTAPSTAASLRDLFVLACLVALVGGLVLPSQLANAAEQVNRSAHNLAHGTLFTLTSAMQALVVGDLDNAHAAISTQRVAVRTNDEFSQMAESFNAVQDQAVRAALALDEAAAELLENRSDLARLVEERTVALIAAHEEIEQAHRRRQDMHDRMRAVSARMGGVGTNGVDLVSALEEMAATLGTVLEVDVIAIYRTDRNGFIQDNPTSWRFGLGSGPDPVLAHLPASTRRFLHAVAERRGTLALADLAQIPDPPQGADEPSFPNDFPYRAWIISPVHDGDGHLLAVLTLGMTGPIAEWNEDAIALVDAVAADLGRVMIQADLYQRQRSLVSQLQELDRAKSEFLSTFSHELRTPLTSIRAYTELLRDDGASIDADQDRMLEIIERNGVRLSVLIEDILTLSHLNSAVYNVTLLPVEVTPLVESVCEALLPMAQAKSLALTSHSTSTAAEVLGDTNQLERLLINLVNNAIKFTPTGGSVRVSVSTSGSSVVLTVADTGIGIPEEEQEEVFGRFFRGAEATNEVIPGTGLGLAIVQAIVEHHSGTLTLNSAPGQGTVIRVRLPALGSENDSDGTAPSTTEVEPEEAEPEGVGRSSDDSFPSEVSVDSNRPGSAHFPGSNRGSGHSATASSPTFRVPNIPHIPHNKEQSP